MNAFRWVSGHPRLRGRATADPLTIPLERENAKLCLEGKHLLFQLAEREERGEPPAPRGAHPPCEEGEGRAHYLPAKSLGLLARRKAGELLQRRLFTGRLEAVSEPVNIEVVVSSWPFRTGSVVYDPLTGTDVAEYSLAELSAEPRVTRRLARLLDPRRPYRRRAEALLEDLSSQQELLSNAYGSEGREVVLLLSDDVERELDRFAREWGLTLAMLLNPLRLEELLQNLEERSLEEHHEFVSTWWEAFARPRSMSGPSSFRLESGPDGQLFGAMTSDRKLAAALWKRSCESMSLSEFSLWDALRLHWAWRLEFKRYRRPQFPLYEQMEELFGSSKRRSPSV